MKPLFLVLPVASLIGAQLARSAAVERAPTTAASEPYAPSPNAAPFVTLGYRELGADLFWMRLTGYFGGAEATSPAVAALVETIVSLDPQFYRPFEWGARAITIAQHADQAMTMRAIAVLERGRAAFPSDYHLPLLESQLYALDLQTADPKQRRAWDEKAALLVESSLRKPGAPASSAGWAATMRTKLGQHDQAVSGLKEMLLITDDDGARERIIAKLAELEQADAAEIASEVLGERRAANNRWQASRPMLPFTFYTIVGDVPSPTIDMTSLATGGHDLAAPDPVEALPPIQ